jgi:hypothetical protein
MGTYTIPYNTFVVVVVVVVLEPMVSYWILLDSLLVRFGIICSGANDIG